MADAIEMVTPSKPIALFIKQDSHDQQPTPLAQTSTDDGSRSRIRITAILLALSVRDSIEYPLTFASANLFIALSIHLSPRHHNRCHRHPHHLSRPESRIRLSLDRRCLHPCFCSRCSTMGQIVRYLGPQTHPSRRRGLVRRELGALCTCQQH